ncbi:MAG: PAS domain-containing protein [Gammaproteobacteria bacterium]|nr:PAS domain-containing protein [Gammaproteobacteria bacterium]
MLDAQATGLLVLDGQLCTIYANVGAQDLLGLGLNQARGRPLSELFVDAAPLTALLRLALERDEPCAGHELSLLPVAGLQGPRPPAVVDAAVTPLSGPTSGRYLLLELSDARLRQRITRESEMLSRFDGGRMMARQLAHEIRNPLGGLRGAAQLLERELPDAGLKEYTTIIINEADRLRTLVDTLLGPSRPPRRTPLNIHEICEHVHRLLRAEASDCVLIERDYDPSVPSGAFDRDELIQALLNVARNALQAIGGHGRIVLRTRTLSNVSVGGRRRRLVACVQVEDDGPGVAPQLQQTLFYPLVTGRPDGTGLGLSVAQQLVSRHDGILEYESRPGRTVFTLLLPLEGHE